VSAVDEIAPKGLLHQSRLMTWLMDHLKKKNENNADPQSLIDKGQQEMGSKGVKNE